MGPEEQEALKGRAWSIERRDRGPMQCCGAGKYQVGREEPQRSHIGMAVQALLHLAAHRPRYGVSWYEAAAGKPRAGIR